MDSPSSFTSYVIEDRSHLSLLKREIHSKAIHAGFPKTRIAEIDIVVSEITSNLIKYAGKGELLTRMSTTEPDNPCLEILCLDNGPGMSDPARMMKDGVSTRHTLGQGLGAIKRLSDFFQLYSLKGWGTVVYSKLTAKKDDATDKKGIKISSLNVPKAPELVSGDGHAVKQNETGITIFFADGLGHGEAAHEAVQTGLAAFNTCPEQSPAEILRYIDHQVKKTRGMVGTAAVFNKVSNEWTLCGIGNISSRTYSGLEFKNYMAYNGIIGLNIPNTLKDVKIVGERSQHMIMCSDGIRTRWDLTKYPAILKYDTLVLAACLYKDFSRGNDDSSILIATVNSIR